MITILLSAIFGAMVSLIVLALFHKKPLEVIEYEAIIDNLEAKISGIAYDRDRLEERCNNLAKRLSYEKTLAKQQLAFKNKLIKQLTDDLEFANKLEIIKEMEK